MKFVFPFLLCAAALHGSDSDPAALAAQGLQEFRDHNSKAAEKDLDRALKKWQSQPGGPPPEFAVPAMVMAAILQGNAKYGDEERLLDRVQKVYRAEAPGDGSDLALFLELRSAALERSGNGDSAKDLKARALAIRDGLITKQFGADPSPPPDQPRDTLRIGNVDRKPRLIYKVDPDYSEIARLAKVQGTAVFAIVVDAAGMPSRVHLIRTVGFGLDEEGAAALMKWRFEPGIKDGKPVRVAATIEVNFRLLSKPR